MFSFAATAQGQSVDESRWVLDLGAGIDVSVNGNVNFGAIGRLQPKWINWSAPASTRSTTTALA